MRTITAVIILALVALILILAGVVYAEPVHTQPQQGNIKCFGFEQSMNRQYRYMRAAENKLPMMRRALNGTKRNLRKHPNSRWAQWRYRNALRNWNGATRLYRSRLAGYRAAKRRYNRCMK